PAMDRASTLFVMPMVRSFRPAGPGLAGGPCGAGEHAKASTTAVASIATARTGGRGRLPTAILQVRESVGHTPIVRILPVRRPVCMEYGRMRMAFAGPATSECDLASPSKGTSPIVRIAGESDVAHPTAGIPKERD